MKKIIVIRHCSATGQKRDAELTIDGKNQANILATFLLESQPQIDHIISSPFVRAIDSIRPYALQANLSIQEDERLAERILSDVPMDDWMQKLESTFTNIDIAFSGGESTKQATDRAISLIQDVLKLTHTTTLLVTHGNLLTLILRHFDQTIGFNEWRALTNPDIYEITINEQCALKRLWKAPSK
ncbi:histidine phosphatase family protein [Bacillus cereus]|uniref:Histidine phosphatase family protein n=1 Tax=Bacillus cereus TaxID=1396 RepID=A0A2B0M4L2_BACCE|nr:histidine phosphatase family protein [Bacillus cereus]PEC84008.1 histidine phosphatase family protein [Bacillus cereus]PEQ46063.1 histidine phosphatase family protein [Bacillus cereus]PEX37035.1 histidine phosphatase family protein [Bacillus cereus]PFB11309.1 histidine phosphatase family protein [Bacillus cereus]PFB61019.1 histidine phosphatase family protein [Bacillus cereus]